jgi:hypothetical protein
MFCTLEEKDWSWVPQYILVYLVQYKVDVRGTHYNTVLISWVLRLSLILFPLQRFSLISCSLTSEGVIYTAIGI